MACAGPSSHVHRPRVDGKFLRLGGSRFVIKGVSYGTFAPRTDGVQFPCREVVDEDFEVMQQQGINTVRIYTPPSVALLDSALAHGVRVMVGVPWTQHVAFLDNRHLRRQIRRDIVRQVRDVHEHPAALLFALGNEIPAAVVRWHGARAVERFLGELYEDAKSAAPDAVVTYVNYPPTEHLELACFDVCAFNVYLHAEESLRAYLARLQHIAGQKPLLIAEAGADSVRHGEDGQAHLTAMQLRAAFEAGACGAIAFAWTDEWWRGGAAIDDWAFGMVDANRRPKAALAATSQVFATAPFEPRERATWPTVSVVVCAHNAASTLDECLSSLERLRYPAFEVIVVNDGSTDATGDIAKRHASARVIEVPNGGLSRARNIGMREATGMVVAYCDADAHVDEDWLTFLVQPLLDASFVAAGGPNVVPADDPWLAQCVARAPGAPTHVLLTDRVAEHIPGCNMAFRRDALLAIDGFNPIYLRAADDVDVCWRLQAQGGLIGFAPSALVWHHHRSSIRAYWRQQMGYGEGEEWLRPHHPEKFAGRRILWRGLVYSPLPFIRSLSGRRVNSGVWGSAPFPSVYRVDAHPLAYLPHSARWQLASMLLMLAGGVAFAAGVAAGAAVSLAGALGLLVTFAKCLAYAFASDIRTLAPIAMLSPALSRMVYRLTIAWLHVVQPLARFAGRLRALRDWPVDTESAERPVRAERQVPQQRWSELVRLLTGASLGQRFWSESWTSSADILNRLVERLRLSRLGADIDVDEGWWTDRDLSVSVAPGVTLILRSLIEDHGSGRCLFRIAVRMRGAWLPALLAALGVGGLTLAASTVGPSSTAIATALIVGSVFVCAATLRITARAAEQSAILRDAIQRVADEFGMSDTTRVPAATIPMWRTAARVLQGQR